MDLPSTELSLCAGIGGLTLGLRRAVVGLRTVCYVERDAYAAAVLVARMEKADLDRAPVWDDLATFDGKPWRGRVDLVSGGTPCQDLSAAGKRAGLDGERSGLFWEYLRVVREVQPRFVFWENVASGATGGALPRVVGAFREAGYLVANGPDGRPYVVLGADDVGAPHRRLRVFVLAYSPGERLGEPADEVPTERGGGEARRGAGGGGGRVADTEGERWPERRAGPSGEQGGPGASGHGGALANPHGDGRESHRLRERGREMEAGPAGGRPGLANPYGTIPGGFGRLRDGERPAHRHDAGGRGGELPAFPPGPGDAEAWRAVLERWPALAPAVPAVRGVAHGLSAGLDRARADRLRCLGNAAVPAQVALAWRVLWRGVP